MKMDDNFDLGRLRQHVERCDRLDREFSLQSFKSRANVAGLHET